MKQFYAIVIFIFLTGILTTASGQVTKTWVPTTGGDWKVAGNWSPNGVPSATDHVLIPGNQSGAITRASTDGETITLKGLTISGNVNLQFNPGSANVCTLNITESLTIDASKTLTVGIDDAGRMNLTLASTAIGTVNGTVYMNSYSGFGYDRTFANSGSLTISNGGIITGQNASIFTLSSDATLKIANAAGITSSGATGAIQIPGDRNFNVAANYIYNGTADQNTGNGFPNNLTGTLTIDNAGNTVTLSNGRTIGGSINLTNGEFDANGNLTISGTGTPVINRSEGTLIGTFTGTNDYDVSYTGNSKTAGNELSQGGLRSITVNLSANQTLTLNATRTPDGNLAVSSGTFDLSTFTINRSGGGGTLTVSNAAKLKIGGTNTFPSNYTAHSIGASSTIEYSGTAQVVGALNSSQAYGNLTLSGSGIKNFSAARTVNGTLSMQGTATTTGTSVTFGASSALEYKGSSGQTSTNVEFPASNGPRSLTIYNSSGVTLHAARSLNTALTLTSGVLNTTGSLLTLNSGATVSGASDASFVDGPVKKIGAGSFDFPVGKSGVGYMKIGIANVAGATTEFTAQYFRASAMTTFGTAGLTGLGIQAVSNCEYWTLNRAVTTSSADVTLYWNSHSPCGSGSYLVDPLFGIRIVHFNTGTSTWDANGAGSPSGNAATGSVTWTGVSNFSPFALGALAGTQNGLPVLFNDVKGYEKNNGVQVDWNNLTERDLINYVIERSANGVNFTAISEQLPRGNNNDKQTYSSFDAAPFTGANYYRIKVYEISGKIIYSKVIRVDIGRTSQGFSLYPNPVKGNQVSVSINTAKGQYSVKVMNTAGQEIYSQRIIHQGGSLTQVVELPSSIKPGVYNMMINGDNYRESKMFIVQ